MKNDPQNAKIRKILFFYSNGVEEKQICPFQQIKKYRILVFELNLIVEFYNAGIFYNVSFLEIHVGVIVPTLYVAKAH